MSFLDLNDTPGRPFEEAEARRARVKRAAAARIRDLVRFLFPAARIGPEQARIGNIHGEPGESLVIELLGERAGLWTDHADEAHRGDVFDLWAAAMGLDPRNDFPRIVSDLDAWAGGKPVSQEITQAVERRRSRHGDKPPEVRLEEVAKWTYTSAQGAPILSVIRFERYAADTGKHLGKTFRQWDEANCKWGTVEPRPLYNLPAVVGARHVVLCEGEKCADALAEVGYVATAVPGGANCHLDKVDWSPLGSAAVTIWRDNDAPGLAFEAGVAAELKRRGLRVARVIVPEGREEGWDAADALEAGESDLVHQLLREAREIDAPDASRVPILSVADLATMPPPEWLISDLLVEGGLSTNYGASESFKSFISLDLALSVATGQDWCGHTVRAGTVVYVIAEGVAGWPQRVFTWLERRGNGQEARFWTVPVGVNLTEEADAQALLSAIQGVCTDPALVVLDTLARNFGPGDENATQDMNRFVSAVDGIRQATGAHVHLVHHTGKDSERGARGSSVLRGALDTEILSHRPNPDGRYVEFRVTKQKDIEKADPLLFEMVTARATHPVTGEEISSLVPTLRQAHEVGLGVGNEPQNMILEALLAGPMTTSELMEYLGMSNAWVRKYIAPLIHCEKVFARQKGKEVLYTSYAQMPDRGAR